MAAPATISSEPIKYNKEENEENKPVLQRLIASTNACILRPFSFFVSWNGAIWFLRCFLACGQNLLCTEDHFRPMRTCPVGEGVPCRPTEFQRPLCSARHWPLQACSHWHTRASPLL